MNIIQGMFNVAVSGNHLQNYATDFIVHDMKMLSDVKKGDVIAWGVRKMGTHLYFLNHNEESNYVRTSLSAFKQAFTDTEWFIVEVESDADFGNSIFPNGKVNQASYDDVLNRFEQEQVVLNRQEASLNE